MHVHGELTQHQEKLAKPVVTVCGGKGATRMQQIDNGVRASRIEGAVWRKSRRSNPSGNCVELAALPDGQFAVRNSRHPEGPALIYTREEMIAFIGGAKDGDFDSLVG